MTRPFVVYILAAVVLSLVFAEVVLDITRVARDPLLADLLRLLVAALIAVTAGATVAVAKAKGGPK